MLVLIYISLEIIRSRDAKILEGCDVIVDVGGIYDSKIHRYDHHQRGFEETMTIGETKFHTKLSSAGLIYRHFGEEVISNLCQNVKGNSLQVVYKKVYESFIEEFDGVDNGVDRYPADIVPKYQISTTISDRVRRLNPDWNEKSDDLDQRFEKAMELTGKEFVECVKGYAFSWLPARDIVEKSMKKRFEYGK